MNIKLLKTAFALLFIALAGSTISQAQGISGYVMNESNEPVPYVNIYLKNRDVGTSTDNEGKYYLRLIPGEYTLIFSSVGYELYELNVVVGEDPVVKNIWLKPSSTELDQIIVKASKKDPAYEIIQLAIESRKDSRINSLRSKVYIKAIEDIERFNKKDKKEVVSLEGKPIDPFESESTGQDDIRSTNMVEMNLLLEFESPDNYKEERTGYKKYGTDVGLFLPKFSETNFDIYENLIFLKGVTQGPIVSPLSRTSILSYKYKLEKVLKEDSLTVYKIKVLPRKKGNSTCSGYLYINDGLWNVNRLELEFEKGALKFYDNFVINQDYKPVDNEPSWVAYRQEFTYGSKNGKRNFDAKTIMRYDSIELNIDFPAKYFSNEVAVITQKAYDRDSSYWNSTRPEPLTIKEQEVVHYRDSIYNVVNSKEYKDSIDAAYNRISLGDIFIEGIGFQNHSKQERIYLPSLLNMIDFSVVGGWRVSLYASYFKRFNNGKVLSTVLSPNYGLQNADLQGRASVFLRYAPFAQGDIQVSGGRSFMSINPNDAYLNQLKVSNYILHDYTSLFHRIELFNGFYTRFSGEFHVRQSVFDLDTETVLNNFIEQDDPLEFEDYEAFITDLSFSYTPAQKYMREPTFKRVLGSDWPTFTATYRKGWDRAFGSDIDFDYIEGKINQNVVLGIFGSSNYQIQIGKFINTTDLRFVDVRRFRQSDPILYSNPLGSFQLLDTAMLTTDWFIEAHHIHHFNGALINNIPLIKKLRFNVVAGAGILWIKENNYRHEEIFAGIERIFKFGARRRLRIGLYGVVAESNYAPLNTGWKISFDLIDTWKREWSY